MKLVTFEIPTIAGALRRVGLMLDEGILDAQAAYGAWLCEEKGALDYERLAEGAIPNDMLIIIRNGRATLDCLETAKDYYESTKKLEHNGRKLIYDREEVRLLQPLPNPISMRDFSAFPKHHAALAGTNCFQNEAEVKRIMELKFNKNRPFNYRTSVTNHAGPDDVLSWPTGEQETQMDYELELAFYIGKPCRNIKPEEALDYIFGVSLYNDITCHDILTREHQDKAYIDKGKNFTGSNIYGPCIVTLDELDVHNIRARVYHNGILRGEESTAAMALTPEDMISYLSRSDYLMPGEIIGTGTFSGGTLREFGLTLQPGDEIVLEGDGLGRLRTMVGFPERSEMK